MTSDNTEKASGTLTSLINTIQRHLASREDEDQYHLDNIERVRQAFEEARERSPEKGRLGYSLQQTVGVVRSKLLVEDLLDALHKNPYPGGQHRLLTVATTLFPGIKCWGWTGRTAWRTILLRYKLNPNMLVWFPDAQVTNIEEVEQQLLALVSEEGYVPASTLAMVLSSSPTSTAYRTTKAALEDRGWSWSTRRSQRTTIKVITPPS